MPPAKRTTSTAKSAETKAEDQKAPEAPKDEAPKAVPVEPQKDDVKSAEDKAKEAAASTAPTDETYQDEHVGLSQIPAHHDPVVAADHKSASSAMSANQSKIKKAASVQVSQFDTSGFGNPVTDAMHVPGKDKDGKKSKGKK